MADATTTFSSISNNAPNVWIARQTYRLVERNLRIGRYAEKYSLVQRMGKTLRIIRYKRLNLPTVPLTEGTAPDTLAMSLENVDVTVEQWGIVVLMTDVAMITTKHPVLNAAINRTALAMAEVLEREQAVMLLAGTTVVFSGASGPTSRATLIATDVLTTAGILEATTLLRTKGAGESEGGLYNGVMHPVQEGDVLSADSTFKDASNFANVKALQFGEIGIWMGVRWARGNFLPQFKGIAEPGTQTAEVSGSALSGTGGPFANTDVVSVIVVSRDATNDYERKISAIDSLTITASDEDVVITTPTSTNYVYDIYVNDADASTVFKLQFARVAANTAKTLTGFQTTGVAPPAKPAADGTDNVEAFVAWVFGQDAFGRVELNGMSLESHITPAAASFSNPLAQGRKVGSKIMWKSFIIENDFFVRIESSSSFGGQLPA